MVLRRFFSYIHRKLQEFEKRIRCGAIVCVSNYELICRLASIQKLARCLADVDRALAHRAIDLREAERLRALCAEIARDTERKCIEMYRERCG